MLAKIRDSGAQAIIMYGHADTTPIVARQMIEVGLAGKIPLIGNAEFNTETTIKAAPKALEGAIEAAAWLPAWDSPKSNASWRSSKPNIAAIPTTIMPMCIGKPCICWPRPSRLPAAPTGPRFATPCPRSSTDSAMGEVTFDDHNQARLPMILLQIENGKPAIKGAYSPKSSIPPSEDERGVTKMVSAIFEQIVNGIVSGSVYAIVAVGMTMIFGVLRAINFAHGEYYMLGTFGAWFAIEYLELPYPVAIVIGVIATAVIAVVVGKLVMQRIVGAPPETGVLATLGIALVLQNTVILVFGGGYKSFSGGYIEPVSIFGFTLAEQRVLIIIVCILVFVGLEFRELSLLRANGVPCGLYPVEHSECKRSRIDVSVALRPSRLSSRLAQFVRRADGAGECQRL